VEPGTDNAFALVLPHADTEAMQIFLDAFAAAIDPDEHVALVLDQAGRQGSGNLVVPASITLVPLPPYSPELNPVERVWLHLRERFLFHRLHADCDAIVGFACAAWNRLHAETGRLALLCSYPWILQVKPYARLYHRPKCEPACNFHRRPSGATAPDWACATIPHASAGDMLSPQGPSPPGIP